jgi:hypothetical protein
MSFEIARPAWLDSEGAPDWTRAIPDEYWAPEKVGETLVGAFVGERQTPDPQREGEIRSSIVFACVNAEGEVSFRCVGLGRALRTALVDAGVRKMGDGVTLTFLGKPDGKKRFYKGDPNPSAAREVKYDAQGKLVTDGLPF